MSEDNITSRSTRLQATNNIHGQPTEGRRGGTHIQQWRRNLPHMDCIIFDMERSCVTMFSSPEVPTSDDMAAEDGGITGYGRAVPSGVVELLLTVADPLHGPFRHGHHGVRVPPAEHPLTPHQSRDVLTVYSRGGVRRAQLGHEPGDEGMSQE